MTDEQMPPELKNELDEALLALEELIGEAPDEALSMFQSLPAAVRNRPEFRLTQARALQASEDLEQARAICESLSTNVVDEVLLADVHHLLGDLLEDLGHGESANEHFVQTLRLDQSAFEKNRHLPETKLSAKVTTLVNEALAELPDHLRALVSSNEVVLFPAAEEVQAGLDPRAFSAFSAENGRGKWRVFCANLDAEYGDLDDLGEFEEHVLAELKEQLLDHLGRA